MDKVILDETLELAEEVYGEIIGFHPKEGYFFEKGVGFPIMNQTPPCDQQDGPVNVIDNVEDAKCVLNKGGIVMVKTGDYAYSREMGRQIFAPTDQFNVKPTKVGVLR